jgi:superfamily II DNA or RNA helicase
MVVRSYERRKRRRRSQTLRDYQEDAFQKTRESLRKNKKAPLLVLPCGAGKSVVAAEIAKISTGRKKRVLFIVHRQELRQQIEKTFSLCGIDMELCDIEMVVTVGNHLDSTKPPDLIIIDEAHHSVSSSYMKIFNAFPDAWKLGLTATPERLDGKGMSAVFDDLVVGVTAQYLIEKGFLARYRMFSQELADLSNLKVANGDYDMGTLYEGKQIYGDTVKAYKKFADGLKAIAYCSTVKAAEETAEEFRLNGYSAAAISGDTLANERTQIMESFRSGEVMVLCNCDLLGEGIDVPDCSCVIMLRKTMSLTLYIQQAMRCMRHQPDKIAIIIDHVRNCFEHGFPDEERRWSLNGKERRMELSEEPQIKICPECSAVARLAAKVCESCGHVFYEEKEKEEVKLDVELKEITKESMEANRLRPPSYWDYKRMTTFEELEAFRIARNMKKFWSIYSALELGIDIPQELDGAVKWVANKAREAEEAKKRSRSERGQKAST